MHKHWCDVTGHEWECEGAALRQLAGDTEPSVCMCMRHGVPMEDGDHSRCSIELLACPEHRDQQLRAMGYELGQIPAQPSAADGEASSMFKDEDGNPIVGFCLWCDKSFYSMDEVEAHNADNMAACEVSQAMKDEHCMPPVLQMMFKNAGVLDYEDTDDEN